MQMNFRGPRPLAYLLGGLFAVVGSASSVAGGEVGRPERFREQIVPLLERYCYDCHGYGANEGGVSLDDAVAGEEPLADRRLWWAVLKNVRADVMPPQDAERPSADQKQQMIDRLKADALGIDLENPDPGRLTVRRLNRTEYRNTIRDLMGIEFDTEVEFPPDDTGHGFDTIADVLSISPLLLEKYLQAADEIVSQAVPTVSRVVAERAVSGKDFRGEDEEKDAWRLSFYEPATVETQAQLPHDGDYRVVVELRVAAEFDYDPGRAKVTFRVDGEQRLQQELAWQDRAGDRHELEMALEAGEHTLQFQLEPLVPVEQQQRQLDLQISSVRIQGPLDEAHWVASEGYPRFFPRGEPPREDAARKQYATEILQDFVTRAFRRPVDEPTLQRLVGIYESTVQTGTFEEGVARAMVAVLASPRFLFRVEPLATAASEDPYPLIDEYALASRLSYFLWSTMPDAELFELAQRRELRQNLAAQVQRMIRDERSGALIQNFAGQWLQARDVQSVSIDPLSAAGLQEEYEQLRTQLFAGGRRSRSEPDDPERAAALERLGELRSIRERLDDSLRSAMRRETEMLFEHVVRNEASVLELIDSDYTFLNESLARHYGIEGVEGDQMRRVDLPEDSPRGGILTQGTFLMVTSNPTRTSPVKRGLFILDNILGTPSPPAPAAVPELEEAEKNFGDQKPTLRELLELHRSEAMCASCHARFDPLGLALENFTAMGTWRETEQEQPIDATGELITGEAFDNVHQLKSILRNERRADFYRCLASKLLTYAVGRGLEDYDEHTIDLMADALETHDGRFSALLQSVVESAPFQRQRAAGVDDTLATSPSSTPTDPFGETP